MCEDAPKQEPRPTSLKEPSLGPLENQSQQGEGKERRRQANNVYSIFSKNCGSCKSKTHRASKRIGNSGALNLKLQPQDFFFRKSGFAESFQPTGWDPPHSEEYSHSPGQWSVATNHICTIAPQWPLHLCFIRSWGTCFFFTFSSLRLSSIYTSLSKSTALIFPNVI